MQFFWEQRYHYEMKWNGWQNKNFYVESIDGDREKIRYVHFERSKRRNKNIWTNKNALIKNNDSDFQAKNNSKRTNKQTTFNWEKGQQNWRRIVGMRWNESNADKIESDWEMVQKKRNIMFWSDQANGCISMKNSKRRKKVGAFTFANEQ